MATNALYGMCIALYLLPRSMHINVVCCSCRICRNSSAHLLECLCAHCAPHSALHVFKRCQQRFNLHIYAIPGQSKTINTTSSSDCSALSLSFRIFYFAIHVIFITHLPLCVRVCVCVFGCLCGAIHITMLICYAYLYMANSAIKVNKMYKPMNRRVQFYVFATKANSRKVGTPNIERAIKRRREGQRHRPWLVLPCRSNTVIHLFLDLSFIVTMCQLRNAMIRVIFRFSFHFRCHYSVCACVNACELKHE